MKGPMSAQPFPVESRSSDHDEVCPLCNQRLPLSLQGEKRVQEKLENDALLWPSVEVDFARPPLAPKREAPAVGPTVKPCRKCGAETANDPYRRKLHDGGYRCDACTLEAWDHLVHARIRVRRWALRGGLLLAVIGIVSSALMATKAYNDVTSKRPPIIRR
jgi:hypothetical protein